MPWQYKQTHVMLGNHGFFFCHCCCLFCCHNLFFAAVPFSSIIKFHACSCNVQKFVDPAVTSLIRHSVHFVSILYDSFETILLIKKKATQPSEWSVSKANQNSNYKRNLRYKEIRMELFLLMHEYCCNLIFVYSTTESQPLTSPKMTISTIKKNENYSTKLATLNYIFRFPLLFVRSFILALGNITTAK